MISKIEIKNIASYKEAGAILKTDKKINLIYGLNGVGKSTLSKYLQDLNDTDYSDCSIEPKFDTNDVEILVYNQKYIEDNFYNSPSQKGIFSLSKGNKNAKDAIDKAKTNIIKLSALNETKEGEINTLENNFQKKKETAVNATWNIKTDYSGGDRVLKYCLEGYMRSKEDLFNYIKGLAEPITTIKEIKKIKEEVQLLSGNIQKLDKLSIIQFDAKQIETNPLLQKAIVGSGNSTFSNFIQKIGNSDWVQSGIKYISTEENSKVCPFCQQPIDRENLVKKLTDCFDESYKQDIEKLNTVTSSYAILIESINIYSEFSSIVLLEDIKDKYLAAYREFKNCIQENYNLLRNKVQLPSTTILLNNSSDLLIKLNKIILEANNIIEDFNYKIEKKQETLNQLKKEFWNNMRCKYDSIISNIIQEEKEFISKKKVIESTIETNNNEIKKLNTAIIEKQKDVVNIQDAIIHINTELVNLGIDDFSIEPHNDLYKIKRGEKAESIFKSLSEGEKMIISFLYFIEECKGKKTATESDKKKIIVIDDPISSLSHIYVFNIGRLIHNEFLRSNKYEQIFVLTHSLYFFYELTDTNKDRREANQKLFRLFKNEMGSSIIEMKYEEIQNDYHSYWLVIKDKNQPSALIANCMRNIIDYFFNFIEKADYNNVFQKTELQNVRFQAFNRYMNRESHSVGQNIFDIKEFDYDIWKEAFRLVFEKTEYKEHYNRMIK